MLKVDQIYKCIKNQTIQLETNEWIVSEFLKTQVWKCNKYSKWVTVKEKNYTFHYIKCCLSKHYKEIRKQMKNCKIKLQLIQKKVISMFLKGFENLF